MDFIQGEKFIHLQNENIVYCATHDVNQFFRSCQINKPFILITHNSDGYITDNPRYVNMIEPHHHGDVSLMPQNLHKWFGCMVEYQNEKIVSIPIGVPNEMHSHNNIYKGSKFTEIMINISNQKNDKYSDKLLFVNFRISNNYSERIAAYKAVEGKEFCTFSEKLFTEEQLSHHTEVSPPIYTEPYEFFANEISKHKFVLCPIGNGLESHRLWETLYIGSIPITRRNINYSFYEDKLPILMVDDWSEITEDFLIQKYSEITNKLENGFYNLEMLNFSYWKNLILNESKKIS